MEIDINDGSVIRLKEHIIYSVFDDGGVVFNLYDRVSSVINKAGAKIIQLLDGERDVRTLMELFSKEYEQVFDIMRTDVIFFLRDLIKRDWVYICQGRIPK